MTDADRSQWLAAARYWREQEKARRREGRWRAANAAAHEARAAEEKAKALEQQRQEQTA